MLVAIVQGFGKLLFADLNVTRRLVMVEYMNNSRLFWRAKFRVTVGTVF